MYRERVAKVARVVAQGDGTEARELIRGLVEEIRLLPDAGVLRIEVRSALGAVLALAERALQASMCSLPRLRTTKAHPLVRMGFLCSRVHHRRMRGQDSAFGKQCWRRISSSLNPNLTAIEYLIVEEIESPGTLQSVSNLSISLPRRHRHSQSSGRFALMAQRLENATGVRRRAVAALRLTLQHHTLILA